MKKKLAAIFTCAVLLFALTGYGGVNTKEGTEGLTYEQNEGSYIVTGYTGSEVNIVIPDTYNGVPVTAIDDWAFSESDVQSVIFGANMETLSEWAFSNASLLNSVTFTSKSIKIEEHTFSSCISLSEINFTQNNYTIEFSEEAIYRCDGLTTVDLSGANTDESVLDISAFAHCDNLTTLTLPSGISLQDANGYRHYTNGAISSVNNQLAWCDAEIIYK